MYEVIRDVSVEECHWLEEPVTKGTIVEHFFGCTYGCISDYGTAIKFIGKDYFVELPMNSLKEIKENKSKC